MQLGHSICLTITNIKLSNILVTDSHDDRTLADNITKNSGKGKNKSAKLEVRPFMVKNYLWVFVNSMITNPTFDSQVCCTCSLCRTAVCLHTLQWYMFILFGMNHTAAYCSTLAVLFDVVGAPHHACLYSLQSAKYGVHAQVCSAVQLANKCFGAS